MREQRFPWGLGALLVVLIVGGIGFWLGSSSVAPVVVTVPAPAPVAPVTPVYPSYVQPHGGGFPFFPLIFGFIFLVVIFKLIRRAAWNASYGGHGGRGWYDDSGQRSRGRSAYGPGWRGAPWEEWHQRMHGEPPVNRGAPDSPETDLRI